MPALAGIFLGLTLIESHPSERWMSGLSRTPGKRVWVYPHRGFESRLLRHI
jgi:hypothetical protein